MLFNEEILFIKIFFPNSFFLNVLKFQLNLISCVNLFSLLFNIKFFFFRQFIKIFKYFFLNFSFFKKNSIFFLLQVQNDFF